MGQMAKQLSERDPGKFPADTQIPRNETSNAILTRSGKVLNEIDNKVEETRKEIDEEELVVRKKENKIERSKDKENIPSDTKLNKEPFPKALEKQFSKFM